MPIPKPISGERKGEFISRCMGNDVMLAEFPDQPQRAAVCNQQWAEFITPNIQSIKALASFKRYEKWQGEEYLVLPAVLLTEGVHNDLYYPPDQLAKYPAAWNGRPIPIYHPEADGIPVSCNSPAVLPNSVGFVFNTIYENTKLKAELWLNKTKLRQFDPNTLRDLEAGKPVEISTGLWSDEIGNPGFWNDKPYHALVSDIKPDHVALLPGATGACSWQDGCGVPRLNQSQEGGIMVPDREGFWKRVQGLFLTNKKSHDEIRDALYEVLPKQSGQYHYVVEVYNDHFIYNVESEVVESAPAEISGRLYKRSYKLNGDVVELGDRQEVKMEKKFVPVTNQEPETNEPQGSEVNPEPTAPVTNQGCNEGEPTVSAEGSKKSVWERLKEWFKANEVECEDQQRLMLALESIENSNILTTNDDGGGNMSVKDLVDALIKSKDTDYDEEDREWLEGLSEGKLKKLSPKAAPKTNEPEPVKEPEPVEEPVTNVAPDPEPTKPTKEPEPKVNEPKPLTMEELLSSQEFAKAMITTVKTLMGQEKKSELAQQVKKIKGLSLTDEEIRGMSETTLEKLIKANSTGNYAGRGTDTGRPVEREAAPEPPSILTAKIEKEVKQ